ncbi:hypothetical protein ACFVXC_42080 [Streptomyces sp. NPDC058257]|uniref:hypothetical protein n=1 Tax=Streptomyces sp. NPDC058257 TaxID=3346409 RepID=UPI0036E90E84
MATAVVFGFAVGAAKPLWQHWWFAAKMCGGTLSSADLADVLPDERLHIRTDEVSLEGGGMECRISTDDEHRALSVEVMSDGAGIDRELDMSFTIPVEPNYVFPDGTPGFADQFGPVILQECPKLGRDELGAKQRLLTRVIGPDTSNEPGPALLRIAASAANAASEQSGCGAKRLPLPERTAGLESRPLSEAAGTKECGWLTGVRLPKNPSGRPWEFTERSSGDMPITSCALVDPAKGKGGAPVVEFSGWYGDWTDEPFQTLLAANVDYPSDRSARGPMMADALGRATAQCDGEAANFQAHSVPRTNDISDRYVTGAQLRPLLLEFAAEQSRVHGCSGLKLPGKTVYPMS